MADVKLGETNMTTTATTATKITCGYGSCHATASRYVWRHNERRAVCKRHADALKELDSAYTVEPLEKQVSKRKQHKPQIGDIVTTTTPEEAYGSGYGGQSIQWFTPGMVGCVARVDVPCVYWKKGMPHTFNCVDFIGNDGKVRRVGLYDRDVVNINGLGMTLQQALDTAAQHIYPPEVRSGDVEIHTYLDGRGYRLTIRYITRHVNTLEALVTALEECQVDTTQRTWGITQY